MSASPAAVPDDTEVIPPKCPEANIAAVPDDTEVVPDKEPISECRSGTGRHGGRLSQEQQNQSHRQKTQRLCASARDHSARNTPPIQDCPENPGVKPVATKKGSSSFTGKILLCA